MVSPPPFDPYRDWLNYANETRQFGGGAPPLQWFSTTAVPKPTFGLPAEDRPPSTPATGFPPGPHAPADTSSPTPAAPADTGGGGSDVDWAELFWGSLGLPPDVMRRINDIFKQYPDVTQAQLIAQQYLRTTPWYAQTFPGINEGIKAGLFTDEQGYRGYVNQLNVLSNQYLGRHVSSDEVLSALTEGIDPNIFGKRLEGNAWVGANSAEAQYELGAFTPEGQASQSDLTALGRQQVGLTTPLGYTLATRLQQASQRMQALFGGTLAKAATTLGPQGLYSPALSGQKAVNTAAGSPDVGA